MRILVLDGMALGCPGRCKELASVDFLACLNGISNS